MSDTITVRDHSQPCAHANRAFHLRGQYWKCYELGCPGGKEIVLRRMQTFPEGCWVEVDGNE